MRHGVTITRIRATTPASPTASAPEVGKRGGTLTMRDTRTPRRLDGAAQSGGHRDWNSLRAVDGYSA